MSAGGPAKRGWRLDRGGSGYPDCLEQLGGRAPAALWGLGDRDLVASLDPAQAVTIVGARRSGGYGCGVSRDLGFGAGAAGLLVVSGMAAGCDSAAHKGALDAGGLTVAVLGCGPDVVYPWSNHSLYARILASGGAILAEHPPGTEPKATHFPARNRIMAAFAATIVVVEGTVRSGTRHTVDQAAGLGREVCAVPGPVTSALSELPNDLISTGATVVRDAQDLLDVGIGVGRHVVRGVGPRLDPDLEAVLLAVEGGAGTCDVVATATGAVGGSAAVALARLELLGYVAADAVGRFSRTTLQVPRPYPAAHGAGP